MSAEIHNIVIDCADPWALARFWSAVLGRPILPENEAGDEEVGIPLESGGELICIRVPEPKTVKNRVHLCLRPDGDREEEVARLLAAGATLVDDRRRPDGRGWAVLGDPEGNEFCVLRSATAVPAASG